MKFLVINGPNINMLGIREKEIYGTKSYQDLVDTILEHAKKINATVDIKQSNVEGEIINYLQAAYFEGYNGVVLNAGGYTHTSVAIRDAIKAIQIPTVEVHLSNPDEREIFRQTNLIKDVCAARYLGFGFNGYLMALDYLKQDYENNN